MDDFYETTSHSWMERLRAAFQGAVFGPLIVSLAVLLLRWNEGNAVREERGLKEGAGEVISVSSKAIDPANEGRLIHLTGDISAKYQIYEPDFHFSVPALRLIRTVEVYQWTEDSDVETHKHFGGSAEVEKHYTYSKEWSDRMISSATFKVPRDHVNPPSFPVERAKLYGPNTTLGAFQIHWEIIQEMKDDVPLEATAEMWQHLPPNLKSKTHIEGGSFYLGRDPKNPEVGDARVSFQIVKPGPFSILARQTGNTLTSFETREHTLIRRVESGTLAPAVMFKHAQRDNHIITWLLRLAGWLVMAIGIGLFLLPAKVFTDVVPFAGTVVGYGITFLAAALAFSGSLVVIAFAWLALRPQLAAILIASAVVVAAFFFVQMLARDNN